MISLGHTDMRVSTMGLGTWAIGGGPAWDVDMSVQECVDTICQAKKYGMDLIDTAPGYNFGNSEKIVGEALKHMKRNEVKIITKCGIVWNRTGSLFNKVGDRQLYKNLSPESIREEIVESMDRLGTDYIDIYMTHWQSVEPFFTPISETMAVLNELKAEGKIRAIGAANISVAEIDEYLKHGNLDIVQAKYSILDRAIEADLIPVCQKHNITLQAYSPLEQGLLSGDIPRDYVPQGARANKKWFQPANLPRVIDMLEKWKPLCAKYKCNIPNLALAWIINQSDSITLLSGATSVDQVKENVQACDIALDADDLAQMRAWAESLD